MLLGLAAPTAAPAGSALGRAFAQAWERAPQAAGLDGREAEARAMRDLAAGLTPEPAAVSVGSLDDRFDRKLGKQEYEIELAVPLWLPGQRAARAGEAAQRIEAAAAPRAALRLEIAGEVREAWWALTLARGAVAVSQRRLETARALETDVLRRHEVGELSRIDANLARSETRSASAELIDAESSLLQAEQALRTLVGTAAPADLAEEPAVHAPPADAADALERRHPAALAAAAAARVAQARVRVADQSRRASPELALRVVRERGDYAEAFANTVGVRLTIPLSSDPFVRRETSAAQAEASQADAEWARAQVRVRLAAQRAERDLGASERQLALAAERRQLAAENLRLIEKAFALGEADLASLLRIRATAFDADAEFARQRVTRAAAISRLNQAMGVLP